MVDGLPLLARAADVVLAVVEVGRIDRHPYKSRRDLYGSDLSDRGADGATVLQSRAATGLSVGDCAVGRNGRGNDRRGVVAATRTRDNASAKRPICVILLPGLRPRRRRDRIPPVASRAHLCAGC